MITVPNIGVCHFGTYQLDILEQSIEGRRKVYIISVYDYLILESLHQCEIRKMCYNTIAFNFGLPSPVLILIWLGLLIGKFAGALVRKLVASSGVDKKIRDMIGEEKSPNLCFPVLLE